MEQRPWPRRGTSVQRRAAADELDEPSANASSELAEAVLRAQQGDEDAFRLIYRSVQPGLLRYLRGLVGDDAEDVASEAWSQIARDMGSFAGAEQGFRGWVATIARNRAMDHIRYQKRRPVTAGLATDDLYDRPATDDTARQALEHVGTEEAIAFIASLPRDQAEAVLLRVVMGLDVATAAGVLGKRSGAVRTSAHRGLRRLAERLADRANDGRSSPTASVDGGQDGHG